MFLSAGKTSSVPSKMAIATKKIKELLEDLAYLESYAQDLFSFLPLPIFYLSPRGVILEANPATEKISGLKSYELVGESIEIFFGKKTQEILDLLKKEKLIEAKEYTFFDKKKRPIPVSLFAQPRKRERETVGYFVGIYDLSQIKKVEEELKKAQLALLNMLEDTEQARKRAEEEKEKTLAIISNFSDGLLFFDQQKRLILINPQAQKFFDLSAREVEGKSLEQLLKIEKLKPLIELLKKEEEVYRQELTLRENLILEATSLPILRERKKIGELLILHDVTREKRIERMKTEFVSIAAHQLRTPLSAIKWTLRMFLDGDLGEITEEQREFLAKTYKSNERMIILINDLLNVTRIEEGRYLYRPVFVNFLDLVQSVINLFKEEIKNKKIQFKLIKPKKILRVKVDQEKMRVAIQNLIDNALRYTLPGGKVTVEIKCAKMELEFSVKDSGVGIPQDQQDRVFTKFFRGANVIRMETEGSGLGLFITKNIIEAHRGRIWFKSKENVGSTFYFTLPLKEEFEEFLRKF